MINTISKNNEIIEGFDEESILDEYVSPKDLTVTKEMLKVVRYKPHGYEIKTRIPYFILTKKPIVAKIFNKTEYRLVPTLKNIIVSKYGEIFDLDNWSFLTPTLYGDYFSVNVYSNIEKKNISIRQHRIVALAWCENDDFIKKNLVDHLDRNKRNNHASNLEWVSASTNVSRASNNTYDPRYLLKNHQTGKIYRKESFRAIGDFIEVDHSGWKHTRLPLHIKKDGIDWIIEDNHNFTDWSLESILDAKEYPFRVYKDKHMYKIKYLNDALKFCNISTANTTESFIKMATKKGYKVKVLRHTLNKTYDVKHLVTGKITTDLLLQDLIDITESPRGTVLSRINPKFRYGLPVNNYIIKLNTDEKWPSLKGHKSYAKKVTVKYKGKEYTFDSLRGASKYMGIDRRNLKRYIV